MLYQAFKPIYKKLLDGDGSELSDKLQEVEDAVKPVERAEEPAKKRGCYKPRFTPEQQ